MTLDLGLLEVERLIIHEIPRVTSEQKEKGIPLKVADMESVLTPEDENFISEKIKHGLAKISYPAEFDPKTDSPIPKLISDILEKKPSEKDRFVFYSQQIAKHLYKSQTAVNPPGILIIRHLPDENPLFARLWSVLTKIWSPL